VTPLEPRKINRVSLAILLAGLLAAVVVWCVAPPTESNGWRDDPWNQKRNRRELERIGGTANKLSAEFIDWFGSLWAGQNLAYTIVVLTITATGGFRFVAVRMEPPSK